jgi:RNA polymerase sigma factor (sigma-70 family)
VTLLVEDRTLLDAFRRGESKAIARVYHAYVDQVAGILRKGFSFMSGGQAIHFKGFANAWDLECAVQDAFISAFSENARQAYDGINPFGPYLLTIARNRVISQLRSDMREYRRRTALSAEPPKEDPESPEQEVMRAELEELVAEFERSLTGDQASFFQRRYREDHNLLEAARLLGLTRMRARTLDKKVRQAFTRFLQERGYVYGSGGSGAGGLFALVLGVAA